MEPGIRERRLGDGLDLCGCEEGFRQQSRNAGAAAYTLPNAGVTNREAVAGAIRASFPLDPPILGGATNWDALKDSLQGGFASLEERRIVFLWPNADAMRPAQDREEALKLLSLIARELADPAKMDGHPKELSIVVEQSSLRKK